jgi:putative peptidoglycan lipid II flippase
MVTASILVFYTLGLAFQGGVQLLMRGFYANHDTKTPDKISFMAMFGNIVLSLVLAYYTPLKVNGLALAYSITSFINMSMLLKTLGKKMNGINSKEIVNSFFKSTIAAVVMGVVIVMLNMMFSRYFDVNDKTIQIIQVTVDTLIGAGVFFVVANILNMQEVSDIKEIIKRKRGRR